MLEPLCPELLPIDWLLFEPLPMLEPLEEPVL
jgi:hypothetical protein